MKPFFWQILNYLGVLVNSAYVIALFWGSSSLIHVPKDILTSIVLWSCLSTIVAPFCLLCEFFKQTLNVCHENDFKTAKKTFSFVCTACLYIQIWTELFVSCGESLLKSLAFCSGNWICELWIEIGNPNDPFCQSTVRSGFMTGNEFDKCAYHVEKQLYSFQWFHNNQPNYRRL